jgi:polyisoprenoid-binding protein YceI
MQRAAQQGTLEVTGTLTIAAASIDTKNNRRDKDLRSARLLDSTSHPDITYTVEGMQPASAAVQVTGSLTVRGRTRPLPFDAKVSATAAEVRLDAQVPVNRADFGLTYSPMRMASLNNTIVIHAVFTRQ